LRAPGELPDWRIVPCDNVPRVGEDPAFLHQSNFDIRTPASTEIGSLLNNVNVCLVLINPCYISRRIFQYVQRITNKQKPSMTSASTAPSTITNFGPLTTTFTPPASCMPSNTGLYCYTGYCAWGFSCGTASAVSAESWILLTECLPSYSLLNYATVVRGILETTIVYSPGLICPQGYTTVLQQIGTKGTYWTNLWTQSQPYSTLSINAPINLEVSPGETAVVCCPR
jgi:hypothetical protein